MSLTNNIHSYYLSQSSSNRHNGKHTKERHKCENKIIKKQEKALRIHSIPQIKHIILTWCSLSLVDVDVTSLADVVVEVLLSGLATPRL